MGFTSSIPNSKIKLIVPNHIHQEKNSSITIADTGLGLNKFSESSTKNSQLNSNSIKDNFTESSFYKNLIKVVAILCAVTVVILISGIASSLPNSQFAALVLFHMSMVYLFVGLVLNKLYYS